MRRVHTTNDTQTVETYTQELSQHLRRGLPETKASEIADEVRAHLHDATTDGAIEVETLQRFGTPRQYARRVLHSAFEDRYSQVARQSTVVLGSAILLVALCWFQFWLPSATSLAIAQLLWRSPALLSVPALLFFMLAFVGKRAHAAFFAACGFIGFSYTAIDGGTNWTMSSSWCPAPKTFRSVGAEFPYERPRQSGEVLLAQGLQVYKAPHPAVPASLRVGESYIVPRPPETFGWRTDEVWLFRQEPSHAAFNVIYNKYRNAYLSRDISEAGVRHLFTAEQQEQEEITRLEAVQPYFTVAMQDEAMKRWRHDAPRLLKFIREEKQRRESRRVSESHYTVTPPFSWEAAGVRAAQFSGVALGVLLGEIIMAWLGRTLWLCTRNRRHHTKRTV